MARIPSCPTPTIPRLLARHPIRFLCISIIVAFLFLNFSFLTEHGEPTYSSRIWGSVFSTGSQRHTLEPQVSYKPKDDAYHINHDNKHDKLQLQLHESKLSIEELRTYIAGKNGYFVRDWSVGLGWNNMRFIIEASLIHAKLLNRILVIPSFVYGRDCEYDRDVCSQYAIEVDRMDYVGPSNESATLAWQLPIQIMLDLPLLRSYYPVILTSEFMGLHGLDPSNELISGQWNRDIHVNSNLTSFHIIPNPTYDEGIFRVDTIRPLPDINVSTIDTRISDLLRKAVKDERYPLYWEDAVRVLGENGYDVEDDEEAERLMNRAGWVVTYTYRGLSKKEFAKTIVQADRQVLPRDRIRGWVEDFTMDVDVLLLAGETHLYRKPGGFRFTTEQARDDYTSFVMTYMRPIQPLVALSDKIARRMTTLYGGRGWLSAHMRRGDFTVLVYKNNRTLEAHLEHIKDIFSKGKERIKEQVLRGGRPRDDDPFFIATDERNASSLEYIRQNGAVLLHDLLTIGDRREIGWPLLFTDVLGIVEQRVAASSAFFYGTMFSSFTGGVLNIRAAMGLEPNSWIVD